MDDDDASMGDLENYEEAERRAWEFADAASVPAAYERPLRLPAATTAPQPWGVPPKQGMKRVASRELQQPLLKKLPLVLRARSSASSQGLLRKVFLRQVRTNKTFAMKVLKKENIVKRNQVEHTRTERSVLGYVRHPFVVGLQMAFQTRDKLFFVLDYCARRRVILPSTKTG